MKHNKNIFSENKWALFIGVIAVAVRIFYLSELSRHIGFNIPMVDEKWHWLWAQDILEKSFWGEGAYFRAPLYPYLLALLRLLTDASIFWTKALQSLFCGVTGFFIFKTAKHLFDNKTAVVSGLIYAFYGTLVFYETMFLIPSIFLMLLVWGMYRVIVYREAVSVKTWLFTGILFGLAAIARPNILLVVPFLMIWMFFSAIDKSTILKRGKLPLMLLAGVIICVIPVTVRNMIVTGDFILISSQGGVNLYLGNNPVANGLTMLMPEVDLDEGVSWDQFGTVTKAAAEREMFRELTEAEESAFWSKKAVDFIKENPGHFISLVWKKTVYLLSGFENSDNADIYYKRGESSLFSLLVWHKLIYFPFGLLLPLTVAGIYLKRKDFRKLFPVYIYLVAYIPSIVLFLVTARHRLPLIPFMIILAGAGLVTVFKKLSTKEYIITTLLFLVPLIVFNRTYYDEGHSNEFQIYFNNGIKYEQLKDYANAEKEYLKADEAYPYSPSLINNLAFSQFNLEKYDDADRNYHRALKLDPNYAPAYNNLGVLLQKKGMIDSALVLYNNAIGYHNPSHTRPNELSQIYLNRADIFESKGMLDSADVSYRLAVQSGPEYPKAYFKGGAFYARYGKFARADSLYSEGQKYEELSAADFFNWGLSFLQRKDYTKALRSLMRAVRYDETIYQGYYCIAVVFNDTQYPVDSVNRYLDLCLKYNPGYEPALEMKKMVNTGR